MAQPEPPLLTAEVIKRQALSAIGLTLIKPAFIASCAGALHPPKPHETPPAVRTPVPAR